MRTGEGAVFSVVFILPDIIKFFSGPSTCINIKRKKTRAGGKRRDAPVGGWAKEESEEEKHFFLSFQDDGYVRDRKKRARVRLGRTVVKVHKLSRITFPPSLPRTPR